MRDVTKLTNCWIFIMAGIVFAKLLDGVNGNSFGDFVSETFLNDDGQITYEGRTITYRASPRSKEFPIKYVGKALDRSSGITTTTAETENFKNPQDASQRAVANLLVILRERGLINDQGQNTQPDSRPITVLPTKPDPIAAEPEQTPTPMPISPVVKEPDQAGGQPAPRYNDSNLDSEEVAENVPGHASENKTEENLNKDEPNAEVEIEPEPNTNFAPDQRDNSNGDAKQGPLPDFDGATSDETGRVPDQDKSNLDLSGWTMRTLMTVFIAVVTASILGYLLNRCQILPFQFSALFSSVISLLGVITIGLICHIFDIFYVNILSKAVQNAVNFTHKLSKSFSNLRGVLRALGSVLEVVPDYKGLYTGYAMKKARPTPDMLTPKYNYLLTSPNKGIAFILNNFEFDNNERHGSHVDLGNIDHLFRELGYINKIHENLTGNEIVQSIREFAAMFNEASYDSAVVVLMSHGNTGVILGTDLAKVKLRDLERELEGDRCPGLKRKPKMYFVQACRGEIPIVIPVVADRPYPNAQQGEEFHPANLDVVPDNEFARSIADVADVHIAFATTEGHLSLRSEVIGSFFVQALCEVFFANAHQDNLDTLMNKVAFRVDRMKGELYDHTTKEWIKVKQTPECLKRGMRKSLYFLPKYSTDK